MGSELREATFRVANVFVTAGIALILHFISVVTSVMFHCHPDNDVEQRIPSRCLRLDARYDSDILALRQHATIFLLIKTPNWLIFKYETFTVKK
jgi:hypothetical protein